MECVLRVRDAKSDRGVRTIALAPSLAEMLWQHRRQSSFQGEDEFVFCHPTKGSPLIVDTYAEAFRAALTAAGITDHVRPFHDLRHASLTNGAAAGETPIALMTRAGHANMKTTQTYLHLAGVVFPDEARRLEERFAASAYASVDERGAQQPPANALHALHAAGGEGHEQRPVARDDDRLPRRGRGCRRADLLAGVARAAGLGTDLREPQST